jgi:ribosomal protein S18 acetylase RimI-like enzyme
MGELPLALGRATQRDHDVIIDLIEAAADWLRTKNTDQWAQPWPSEEDRNHRIRRDLIAGKTWIARRDPAVYVCRLVVSRAFAGRSLGAALLSWAGLRARRYYRARWIRVDVWTTNTALHGYYLRQGFKFCGFSEAFGYYPSAALFQKETGRVRPAGQPLFRIHPPPGG